MVLGFTQPTTKFLGAPIPEGPDVQVPYRPGEGPDVKEPPKGNKPAPPAKQTPKPSDTPPPSLARPDETTAYEPPKWEIPKFPGA